MNYNELVAAVRRWRDVEFDPTLLDSDIDIAIQTVTGSLNRQLRIQAMIVSTRLVMGEEEDPSSTLYIPDDVLQVAMLETDGTVWYQGVDVMNKELCGSGTPLNVYTRIGNTLRLSSSIPASAIAFLTYYGAFKVPSSSVTTNAILTLYPDVYLYGCLSQMGQWYKDTAALQRVTGYFDTAVSQLAENDHYSLWQKNAPIRMNVGA